MKKLFFLLLICSAAVAQVRSSEELKFDLLHTELYVRPQWASQTLEGRAVLTLKPYFYPQSTLVLNAREMEVSYVKTGTNTLKFTNDGRYLSVQLDREYTAEDTLHVEIAYLAQPEKIKEEAGEENKSEKGLYFINAGGTVKGLPTQFWTQGETQSNSAWFPTLDSPNQNHTQDIYITLEKKYTTLSNGVLVGTTDLGNGLKTDHWSQSLPHAVYLTMIAGGDFVKVTDPTFTRFEVSYYMEPEYAPFASGIFGRTPEMIRYFEDLLGVPFPWQKYAQVPIRKFISGAMENTTATTHARSVLKNGHQLVDGHDDAVIAHELFHHWFGNYVTCESWAQLPLNEAFANYSEFLWATHRYGKEEGDFTYLDDLLSYLGEAEEKQVPLIRFNYDNSEEMFDAHSYQKGGRVLHTLRLEVGDKAFFTALNRYLTRHAHQTAEVEDLRIAFEKVTGRDLKWFFDQWFKGAGHPVVQLRREVVGNALELTAVQVTDSLGNGVFRIRFPLRVISSEGQKDTVLTLTKASETFRIPFEGDLKNYIPNADGYFLGVVHDDRTVDELVHQYGASPEVYARLTALGLALSMGGEEPLEDKRIRELLIEALGDTFWRVRQLAVQRFNDYDGEDFLRIEKVLEKSIAEDPSSNVRAEALLAVRNFQNPAHLELARKAMTDTSYSVRAAALEILLAQEVPESDSLVAVYEHVNDGPLFGVIANYYVTTDRTDKTDWMLERMKVMEGMDLYQYMGLLASYLVISEEDALERALPFIRDTAMHESTWYARMSAVRVLYTVKDLSEAAGKAFEEAIAAEKDERLINYYKQMNEEG